MNGTSPEEFTSDAPITDRKATGCWLLGLALAFNACTKSGSPERPDSSSGGSSGAGGVASGGSSGAPHDLLPAARGSELGVPSRAALRVDAGATTEGDWLTEPGAWNTVNVADCELHEAVLGKASIPHREWLSCGVGCQLTPVLPGSNAKGLIQGSFARITSGGLVVGTAITLRDPPQRHFAHVFEVGADKTLMARWTGTPSCRFAFGPNARLLKLTSGGETTQIALAPLAPGESSSWLGSISGFGWDLVDTADAWGYLTFAGSLFVTDSLSAGTPSLVFSGSTATGARSESSMIAWVEWTSPAAVIRRWTAATGSEVMLQRPQHVAKFSVTDSLIVWVELTGEDPLYDQREAASLYWAPTSDLGNAQGGLSLPADVQISRMAASDSWAAVEHCSMDRIPVCSVLAFRLSDGQGWTVTPPAGRTSSILAIDGERLLVTDHEADAEGGQFFDNLRSYALDELASSRAADL